MTSPRTQYGALPYRLNDGQLEIMLVTSRETKRWIIPKGWPMKGKSASQAAAREAFEEAGLVGLIHPKAIGSYDYDKRLRDGAVVVCRVQVFPFQTLKQRRRWPEYEQRTTEWFAASDAADAVQEPALSDLIRGLEDGFRRAA